MRGAFHEAPAKNGALTATIRSNPISSAVNNGNGNILQARQEAQVPTLVGEDFYLLVESLQGGSIVASDIVNALATEFKGDSSLHLFKSLEQ